MKIKENVNLEELYKYGYYPYGEFYLKLTHKYRGKQGVIAINVVSGEIEKHYVWMGGFRIIAHMSISEKSKIINKKYIKDLIEAGYMEEG